MADGLVLEAGVGVLLGIAVEALVGAISRVIKTAERFKQDRNHLDNTVNWITPRIKEINRSKNSQEIKRLLNLLDQAKETVDKCSGLSSWNYYKKYTFAKELSQLDNSIRTTLQVFFPVMILGDTRQILDGVDELKQMFSIFFYIIILGVSFDLIRSKVSFESLGVEKIVRSQPAEIVSDIALWKRNRLSESLLFTSTATWVFLQVYRYNFLTIASWVAIFIVTSLFIWRYVNRILDKEKATKITLKKIRKQVVKKTASACSELTDKVIGWIFHVTDVEREWFVFPQTVAFLLILSYVGSFFDLPTLCIGVIMGTIPAMLAKKGDRLNPFGGMVGSVYKMVEKLINTNNVIKEETEKKKKKQN